LAGIVAQRLEEILTPYVGKAVAQTTVRMQCKAMGLTPETLSPAQLKPLADRITVGLKVFVGAEKAGQIGLLLSKAA
jgi:hypothetical protein